MTTLTLEVPADVYERLHAEARQRGTTVEVVAETWLAERAPTPQTTPAEPTERERAIAALRAAGLLTELSPEEKARAGRSTATLDDVSAALERGGGQPLSEIITEMRGPKT